jgi:hypothetical protein
MHSLIGDRFLKQFFGGRSNRRKVNPVSEAERPMENKGDKLIEPGNLLGENPLEQEATLENIKTDGANNHYGPEDGSAQPANDQSPFTPEEHKSKCV